MADSRKLTIQKRLTAVLEGITPGNGYDYDMTGKVFRGRRVFGDETISPFLSILEAEQPDDNTLARGKFRTIRLEWWVLYVQGWLTPDVENPTDELYNLLASVEKRLSNEILVDTSTNYRLGGVVADCEIPPGMVLAATPEIGGIECFYLPLRLQVCLDLLDPWNLSQNLKG